MAVLWNHVILLIFGCFLEMGVGCQEFFRLIAFYRIVCEQMYLKFVVSLVCGVVCVFCCLPIGFRRLVVLDVYCNPPTNEGST